MTHPVVDEHVGIMVVRDDLVPGGTKARYLAHLFESADECVYATPAYGGAQLALAYCARAAGKRATLFVAKRSEPHPRTREARAVGARVFQVPHGYLSNVQAKAVAYCRDTGAKLVAFGGSSEAALSAIADVARVVASQIGEVDEIWSAAGSGVLTRGLQRARWGGPARFHAVQVGRELEQRDAGRATIHVHRLAFEKEIGGPTPFPSCRNYDAKAWEMCRRLGRGRVLFWNVLGPSPTPHLAALQAEAPVHLR